MLYEKILELNALADAHLAEVEARRRSAELEAPLSAAPRLPLRSSGIVFNAEGVETLYADSEPVEMSLTLPARQVRWELGPGRYRVRIRAEGSAAVSAIRLSGATLFENRRFTDEAVLDLDAGDVTLTATKPLTHVWVERYAARASGEIVLGPFEADALVSARPVGVGSWTVELAPDEPVAGAFAGGRFVAQEPPAFAASGVPWSVASQFMTSPLEPAWTGELLVGTTADPLSAEDVVYAAPQAETRPPRHLYWGGLGQWTVLSRLEAPLMDDSFAYWTYLWGTASGESLVEAYDMRTGQKTRLETVAQVKGFYLVKAVAPSKDQIQWEVDGVHAALGSPLPTSDSPEGLLASGRPALVSRPGGYDVPPGAYRRVALVRRPRAFLVRARGSGLLRAVELVMRSAALDPSGAVVTTTVRESLAAYTAGEAAAVGRPLGGLGLALPLV